MTASGVLMVMVGVTVLAQIFRGGALQRLGLLDCPASTTSPQKSSSSGTSGTVAA